MDVQLIINLDIFESSGLTEKSIVTGFFIRYGETCFPNSEWSDFSAAILNYCISQIDQLLIGQISETSLGFMDGPFYLHVYFATSQVLVIKTMEDWVNKRVIDVIITESTEFRNQLLKAAKTVVEECQKRGLHSTEIKKLTLRTFSSG